MLCCLGEGWSPILCLLRAKKRAPNPPRGAAGRKRGVAEPSCTSSGFGRNRAKSPPWMPFSCKTFLLLLTLLQLCSPPSTGACTRVHGTPLAVGYREVLSAWAAKEIEVLPARLLLAGPAASPGRAQRTQRAPPNPRFGVLQHKSHP